MRKFTASLLIFLFILSPQAVLAKVKLLPVINVDAYGTYTKVKGKDDSWGADVEAVIAPIAKFGNSTYLIPLYNFSLAQEQNLIEEEGTFYGTTLAHYTSLSLKQVFAPRLSGKITGLGKWNYVSQTKDETLGDGLYDYRDAGGAVELEYKLIQREDRLDLLSGAFKYYQREYPHYHSLISLAQQTAPEDKEKDYDGYRFSLNYETNMFKNFQCSALYSLLFADYTQKKVIAEDGVLKSDRREDFIHSIILDFNYTIFKRWTINAEIEGLINDSNQNYYDSRGTLPLNDDVFTRNYYDFYSLKFRPKLTYLWPLANAKVLNLSLYASYLYRQYSKRKVQDDAGNYEDKKQHANEYEFGLLASYPLTRHFHLLGRFDYSINQSNMQYERFYNYNYDLYHISLGLSYRY
jgi:hypothetical protein